MKSLMKKKVVKAMVLIIKRMLMTQKISQLRMTKEVLLIRTKFLKKKAWEAMKELNELLYQILI